MADDSSARIAAITDAIRLARELSTAIAKAEDLGAVLSVEVDTIRIHGKPPLKQVMIYPVKM